MLSKNRQKPAVRLRGHLSFCFALPLLPTAEKIRAVLYTTADAQRMKATQVLRSPLPVTDVANYMREHRYNLRFYVQSNWPRVGLQFVGKLGVYC